MVSVLFMELSIIFTVCLIADHHAPLSSAIAKAVLEEVKGRADLV